MADDAIGDILNRVARKCSVRPPASWVAATSDTHVELRDVFLHDVVEEVLDRVDLPVRVTEAQTLIGTGGALYGLLSHFRRLERSPRAIQEVNNPTRRYIGVSSEGEWQHLVARDRGGSARYFMLENRQGTERLRLHPAPPVGLQIVVSFISNNWLIDPGTGLARGEMKRDDDVSLIPKRILEPGIVAKFRRRKGMEYADVLAEYEAMLARHTADANHFSVINFGEKRARSPFRAEVPDYIPPSS